MTAEGRRLREWRREETGTATAVGLVLGMVFLVLPVMVVVLALPAWEQRAVDAQDAARVGARTLVEATTWQIGEEQAQDAVSLVAEGDGIPVGDVETSCSGYLVPGASVRVSVTVTMPSQDLPVVGWVGPVHYTAVAVAQVDMFRAGS